MEYGKNMILITSYWSNKDTFKMIPVTNDCPFSEVIYDPSTTLLVVIGRTSKENFQMVPRLDEDGNPQRVKKPRDNGKTYKEQRTTLKVLHEHYITERAEQEAFLKTFAVNFDSYDYSKFLRDVDKEPMLMDVEKPTLVDEQGKPLS
tara:strand:- start:6913 stop:7353 length:441 start_codon:yes stop_codon:yes gene_type:complete